MTPTVWGLDGETKSQVLQIETTESDTITVVHAI